MTGFTYKSYSFVDKDPLIYEIRDVFDKSGASKQWVEDESGVTTATLRNWFDGPTRKPQAATVNAVLRALGYKLGIVSLGAAAQPIIPPAREASARHVVQMAKFKRGK
jgi:phosphoserine phosphatase